MSENQVKRITPRQLKSEYNSLGFVFVAIFVLSALIRIGYLALVPILQNVSQITDWKAMDQLFRLVTTFILMIVPFMIYARKKQINTAQLFSPCKSEAHSVITLLVIGLALNLLLTFVTGIISMLLSFTDLQLVAEPMMLEGTLAVRTISVLRSVLIFPFCAEFMFRGICLKSFSRMGNYFAIFASSLLFAVIQSNPVYFISSFVLGVFLCVVTMRFDSIIPALVIHIFINFQTLLLQQVPVKYSWIVGLSCIVVYVLAILLTSRYRSNRIIIKKEADPLILLRYFFTSGFIAATLILYLFFNQFMLGV